MKKQKQKQKQKKKENKNYQRLAVGKKSSFS